MADNDMSTAPELTLPVQFNFTPLRALRVASRKKLSNFLDLEGNLVVVVNEAMESDVVNDYSGLAELAGFNYQAIMNMKRQKSPTTELLDLWTNQNGTVGKLWMYLFLMERPDVLTECRRQILHDCEAFENYQQVMTDAERYNIEQDPTVSTSEMKVDETKFATLQDVKSGERTLYDAFICYSAEDENDRKFLYLMIDELEKTRGLKLFVPGRDDLPGSAEHTITAYLIEKRCTRVVILMSRMFLQSAACDFQVKFAHALAPGARSKKLIPVIREKNTPIPRILRFLAVCDFTKSDMVEWVWDRLFTAIIAPIGPTTYFEEEDLSDPFDTNELQELRYPSPRRLNDHEVLPGNITGNGSRPIAGSAGAQRLPSEHEANTEMWGQPISNNQTQSKTYTSSSFLPGSAGKLQPKGAKGSSVLPTATGNQKQSKPIPEKKPDKLKGKKKKDSKQPSTHTDTTSTSQQKIHYV